MGKTSKVILGVIAVIVLAIAGGYAGSAFRGGSADAIEQGSWLQDVRDRGELRVGIAVAPPMTVEVDGELGGPNVLPLENLAEEMGVDFTPVATEWGNIVAGLQAGHYDVAAYLDATLERSLAINFTDPVLEYEAVFVVEEDSPYSTFQDLLDDGGPIGVAQGTAYEAPLASFGPDLLTLESIPDSMAAVETGRAIAALADYPSVQELAQQDDSKKIIVPEPTIYRATANYGVPADIDPHSMTVINVAINNALDGGELSEAYREAGFIEMSDMGDLEKD